MIHYGLKENEIPELRKKFGENSLPIKEDFSWFFILLSQFKSPLVYILVLVGLVSFVFKEYTDFLLIEIVIVINVLMGFFQEYNSQKTLIALRKILKPKTIVIRNGERKEIESKKLVPGDLVVLGGGDKVPADGQLIEGANLLVNEAILTGEEEAVEKSSKDDNGSLFMGTAVIWGSGVMEVQKIGSQTEIGKIGKSVTEIKERKTPIQINLEKFSKSLAFIIVGVCAAIFLLGLLQKEDNWEMLRTAVVLSVAAIPEGLPIAITVILALGMRRILKRNGLVKKLLSIETLGSTSVICVDKTATLTEGKMQVIKAEFTDQRKALLALALANNQRTNLEIALWNYVKEKEEFDPQETSNLYHKVHDEPFDSEKKYALTINNVEGRNIAFILGAPEIILSFCNISGEEKNSIFIKIDEWANQGLRILGIIRKEEGDLKEKNNYSWLGLVGIDDPIREGVREMILKVRQAGIDLKIVTGDYRKTAEKIAKNLGFEIKPENVLEGKELEVISEAELQKRINDIVLFTRVLPHQKLKIVKALQEKGEIVAMTGDGINDTLALKKADIGVVVGSGTEVAKEIGDLILLDNNFKTIVAAIEEGRLIFLNIKKVVGYVLSNSFAEIILIFGSMLLNFPTPLTVVQILWIHLICDGPPDILLGFEPKEKGMMREKPKDIKREKILSASMKFTIGVVSLTTGLLTLFLFWYFRNKTGDLTLARTVAFATIAIVSLVYIFSFKNLDKSIIKTENFFKNKYLFLGVIYGYLLIFAAIYLPALNRILGTSPLKPVYWLWIFGVALFVTLLVELIKIFKNKSLNK